MLINNANLSGSLTINNASFNVTNGIMSGTSSFALTSSYSLAGSGFPYSGSAQITGSLLVSNLTGSGVRYVVTDGAGNMTAQTASAAIKGNQAYTASAGQTTFAVTNGYTTGLVDVFINGSKLLKGTEYTDTSGTNIVLATGSFANDIVEVVTYQPASGVTNNALRQLTSYTATAGQTVFSASYVPGLLDVYYNGSRLNTADYTAANGTSITLTTASAVGDLLDIMVYSYQVGSFSGIGGTGVANQLAYWNTTNSITGSPNFTVSSSILTLSGSRTVITGSVLVSGSGTFTNNVSIGAAGTAGFAVTSTSTTGYSYLDLINSGASGKNYQIGIAGNGAASGYANNLYFDLVGVGTIMTLTSGGNVGIGTSSPFSLTNFTALSINGTTGGILDLKSNGTTGLLMFSNASATILSEQRNMYMSFETNATERMRITSAGNVQINGPIYRYSGQTVVGGSLVTLVNANFSSSRTYLIQIIPVDSSASTNYRWFGVLQYNYNANSSAITALASQTMDVAMSGGNIQARVTNSQQFTFDWSITQLL